MSLGIHDFDFELPERLIAQQPAHPRDHAKLLVYDRATQRIQDRYFYELDSLLEADTTLVLNNTRVENVVYCLRVEKLKFLCWIR